MTNEVWKELLDSHTKGDDNKVHELLQEPIKVATAYLITLFEAITGKAPDSMDAFNAIHWAIDQALNLKRRDELTEDALSFSATTMMSSVYQFRRLSRADLEKYCKDNPDEVIAQYVLERIKSEPKKQKTTSKEAYKSLSLRNPNTAVPVPDWVKALLLPQPTEHKLSIGR